jgi:hypothetical protein
MTKTDKLDIADELLEASISEFFDHENFFAAFNLAGVAEELYGKYIRILGQEDVQMETIVAAEKLSTSRGAPSQATKEWKKTANYQKNSVKHFDIESERYVDIDAKDEARLMIADALNNHDRLGREQTSATARFNSFGKAWSIDNVTDDPL